MVKLLISSYKRLAELATLVIRGPVITPSTINITQKTELLFVFLYLGNHHCKTGDAIKVEDLKLSERKSSLQLQQ